MTRSIIVLAVLIPLFGGCDERSSTSPVFGQGRQLKVEDFPNIKNSVFGVWSGDQAEFGDELVYLTTYYFNAKNEIGVKRTCVGNGEEVDVATVVDGEIREQEIMIRESAQVSRKGNRISHCTLTVHAGSFTYNLNGNRLEFASKTAAPRSYSRVEN